MMKKLSTTLLSLLLVALSVMAEGKAKYVFFFIGDGMGVNQVNAAETYLGALEGRIGTVDMCFPSFPYAGMVNTQSASNGVTDSAAGGTALATGHKTTNGVLGMTADKKDAVNSIAVWAHEAGAAVGISTSVSIDHATPAAFYSHVPDRGMAYEIGTQLPQTGFEFFAGSDFVKPQNPSGGEDLYAQCTKAGYTLARGYKDYQKKSKKADRMILFQTTEASQADRSAIPYAIDRKKGDLTLTEITRAAIHFLTQKQQSKEGFFLMVEGGKIDWACHANEIATAIHETIDMDNAIKVAYEFYQQHPDETLIVVSADHETGGLSLGSGSYNLYLDRLRYQQMSIAQLGNELHKLHDKLGNNYNWETVKAYLSAHLGLWDKVQVDKNQEKRIRHSFDNIMSGKGKEEKSLYQKDDELASTVKHVINECARVHFGHGGHSAGYVPVYAVGAGAERFAGRIDNTDIPKKIADAAGWQMK